MEKRILIWGLIFLSCMVIGTSIGAFFSEFYSLTNTIASICFSPLSLLLRIFGSIFSLLPNRMVPIWSNGIENMIVICFTVLSIISSFRYFKNGKSAWAITFGISFTVLNFGNVNQYLAMMSI